VQGAAQQALPCAGAYAARQLPLWHACLKVRLLDVQTFNSSR
jgi:hypothetical protein